MTKSVKSWIYEPDSESKPRKELSRVQAVLLSKIARFCNSEIPLYMKKFKDAGISDNDIRTLDDLHKIPFTTKEDLRKAYPYGTLGKELTEVLELHASSGTTGHPTTCAYTRRDLTVWSKVMARIYAAAGATRNDVVQNAYGYGLFTGGLGFHYGALEIGATVLPIASGNTERQIRLARDYETTILACTPSYAAYIGEFAREKMGIDPSVDLKWKSGLFGAEAWSEELRTRIQDLLGLEAFDIYGLSEVIGPGVSVECSEHRGLHVFEDHFLPEIVDPETGQTLDEGKTGELVLTTLTREATPVLRFRTGDITSLTTEECSCGRTLAVMNRIFGRADAMFKVRGVKMWPTTIEHALLSVERAAQNYQIILERPERLDIMTVQVEPKKEAYVAVDGDLDKLHDLKEEISESLRTITGIKANIVLVPYNSLPRFEGKARRVKDLRGSGVF